MSFISENNRNYPSEYIEREVARDIEVSELLKLQPPERISRIKNVLKDIVNREKILIGDKELSKIIKEIYENTFEFGPISSLIRDDKEKELMFNYWGDIIMILA